METDQINRNLSHIPFFLGTFGWDELETKYAVKRPFAIVINTDRISQRGEHWTAVFGPEDGEPEYFDSFGFPPLIQKVQEFMDVNCKKKWIFSNNSIQHPDTTSCGRYCIEFILHRSKGSSFKNFISKFSRDTMLNERMLKR